MRHGVRTLRIWALGPDTDLCENVVTSFPFFEFVSPATKCGLKKKNCGLNNFTYPSGVVILGYSTFLRVFPSRGCCWSGYSGIVLAPAEYLKGLLTTKKDSYPNLSIPSAYFKGDPWWKYASPGSRIAEPREAQVCYLFRFVVHHSSFLFRAHSFHTLAV